ncbi:MAG: glutathione S-transferase family protein [Alphaproteobacteria bacterium]|nr:glutathione S-transferase family protein [Alphaproteobacteria bacterium]MBV8406435.1 glutathione S-transferase family protein [Alphaproteobacteria bacterium]
MILVGQYDSPYTRRVAVSLGLLGFPFEHDARSVFADFDSMRTTNPLGRVPSLVLPDGTTLIDSAAILDWLDQQVGVERALLPPGGPARQQALQRMALATGTIDKVMAAAYERLIRPGAYRWPDWIKRCRTQAEGGLAALAALRWPGDASLGQAWITTACMVGYVRLADPDLLPPGRYPSLDAVSERCEALPAFQAAYPAEYFVPTAEPL